MLENTDTLRPVVMVDDNATDLEIVRRFYAYSKLKNPFLALDSGRALLDYLKRVEHGQERIPALVLLDVNMPRLSGFDALLEVRSFPAFAEVPVIVMMTNSDNPKDEERAMELGANGYQLKHFELASFVGFLDGLFC